MDPLPLFTTLLWCLQALTAVVLLADAYFKMRSTHDEFLQHKRELHVTHEPSSSSMDDTPKNASLADEQQAQQPSGDTKD